MKQMTGKSDVFIDKLPVGHSLRSNKKHNF
jgi:hypothetical protein